MFAERLRKTRLEHELTLKALGAKVSLAESTISLYESGKREPDIQTLEKLAECFGTTVSYLIGEIDTSTPSSSQKGVRIPVLGRIPAGIPIEAIEEVLDFEEIPIEDTLGGKEYFALKIQGDSMSPKYLENDVVIFLKTPDCDSGADCAVIVNGDDATFKKVIKQANGIVLQPLNTAEFEPLFYSNEDVESLPVTVIGVAKQIRRDL